MNSTRRDTWTKFIVYNIIQMLITLYTFQGKTKGNIFFSDLNFSFRDVVADE